MVSEQTVFSPDTGRGYRVLVAEDKALMPSIIMDLMRGEGYDVVEAPSGEVAWQIFEQEKIDLAILDLNLSGGSSGLDVLKKMRAVDSEGMAIIVTAYTSVKSA